MIFKNINIFSLSLIVLLILSAFLLLFIRIKNNKAAKVFLNKTISPYWNLFFYYPKIRFYSLLLLFASLLILSFTLLNPSWGLRQEKISKDALDLLFVVDVSKSMDVRDVKPSRLEKVKTAMKLMVNNLTGQRVGILAFAGKSFYYCPLTSDYSSFLEFLNALESDVIPFPGTNLDELQKKITKVLNNNKATQKILFIFSDGEFHSSLDNIEKIQVNGEDVETFIIGVGTAGGGKIPAGGSYTIFKNSYQQYLSSEGKLIISKFNEDLLIKLAQKLEADYYNISDNFMAVNIMLEKIKKYKGKILGSKISENVISRIYIFLVAVSVLLALYILGDIFRKKDL